MDDLSLQFAEQSALRMVDHCTDLEQLKALTRSLVSGHFQARAFICQLMERNLEAVKQGRCGSCPYASSADQAAER
jgi:hypothetical protein